MDFNQKIYNLLLKIPKGKVSSYKALAEKLNSKAYRSVGNALNKNKHPNTYPCYKIINSSGKLGGYSKGLKLKIKKLKADGIKINSNKIDLSKYIYKFK